MFYDLEIQQLPTETRVKIVEDGVDSMAYEDADPRSLSTPICYENSTPSEPLSTNEDIYASAVFIQKP